MQSWIDLWQKLLIGEGRALAICLLAVAACTLVELLAPAEAGQGIKGRGRNLLYLVIFKGLGVAAIAAWYVFGPDVPVVDREVAGTGNAAMARTAVNVLANVFVADFLYYWYHRAQHHFRFLWAIHELHHADSELNATTSYRTYWLEAPAQFILVAVPTVMLFGNRGPGHAAAVYAVTSAFLIFSHWNVRLSLGPLTSVLCGPQVHRIHHSRFAGHRDKNFAQVLTILDRIFGSYHAPAPGEFPPTGADGLPSDASIGRAMIQPFAIWGGLVGLWTPASIEMPGRIDEAVSRERGGRRKRRP
ncbi:MAG: hypothetical protein CL908_05230 [Deltaproteobacteria bacterium]|nr:hypothetical protein [Deltaproteobacteria bacterium]